MLFYIVTERGGGVLHRLLRATPALLFRALCNNGPVTRDEVACTTTARGAARRHFLVLYGKVFAKQRPLAQLARSLSAMFIVKAARRDFGRMTCTGRGCPRATSILNNVIIFQNNKFLPVQAKDLCRGCSVEQWNSNV